LSSFRSRARTKKAEVAAEQRTDDEWLELVARAIRAVVNWVVYTPIRPRWPAGSAAPSLITSLCGERSALAHLSASLIDLARRAAR
jgi:hypothetical protein